VADFVIVEFSTFIVAGGKSSGLFLKELDWG
jgi:hypothetical protein